jgi:ATP-dependent helicase/nuclease subunit A
VSGRFRPEDEEARERARTDHATSLVLEAGAGTGKTTLLVDRIERLIRSGHARLDQIAAVTFTENAATTMKLRLRERLERVRADGGVPTVERERCSAALEMLERAQVSTIHALCAAILQERPLECGVVPGFRMADEAEADIVFSEAWEEWLAERLTGGDDVLLEALDQQIPLEGFGPWGDRAALRGLARTLVDERDLEPLRAPAETDVEAYRKELLAKAARAAELVRGLPDADVLVARLKSLAHFAEKSRFLKGRELAAHLSNIATIQRNVGFRPRWPSDEALQEARGIAGWTHEWRERFSSSRSAALHGRLVTALLDVVSIYERKKSERGVLDFLDLLVKARDALRDRESVRLYFRERFKTLIIDEFQDTDPLQVQVADLLAGDEPGRLVVVGDAKQSIYRFRRAEVALFRRASAEAGARPGWAVLHLTQNFRSRPSILRFVNRVFGGLIQASDESGQPAYEPIAAPPGLREEPSVVALRFGEAYLGGEDLLAQEARALAAFLAHVAAGGETVRDLASGQERASRAGDAMVLVRRLTHVRLVEEALDAAGLRFTVEGGKSFFDRSEVHEVLAVLRAVEDPTDRVSLVAALRSSFMGVSDREIVAYALGRGDLRVDAERLDFTPDPEFPGSAALLPALALLSRLRRERTNVSVPALLEMLYDETRILAALTRTLRGEGAIANLRKVVTLARSASELGVLTLRGFTRLLEERASGAREEPDLPVTRSGDPDTIRILSVHKAKGLEAPVVACFDTADNFFAGSSVIPLFEEGTVAIGFRKGCQPPQWDELVKREEKKAWAEARRLLYVAATRARDLLVIPQPPASAEFGSFWKDLFTALPARGDDDVRVVDSTMLPAPERERARELREVGAAAGGDAVAARWEAERRELLEEASYRAFIPTKATALGAEAGVAPVPFPTSAQGRDFGAFVHKLLEWVPFTGMDRAEVGRMAKALAPSFRLKDREAERAADHVGRVLDMPLIGRARHAKRVWREIPLFFPEEGKLVEGVVDLVFEEEDGLVVLDYKTEGMAPGEEALRADRHAAQLRAYHRGIRDALGRPVKERFVVFTAVGRAVPV